MPTSTMPTSGIAAKHTTDPVVALAQLGAFLDADPVVNNVIRTLLEARAQAGGECSCSWAESAERPIGVAYRWPPNMPVQLSAMADDAVEPLAAALADAESPVDAIAGPVPAVAAVAGAFATITRRGAVPEEGMRLYEVRGVIAPRPRAGRARPASAADVELLTEWMSAFDAETGAIPPAGEDAADRVRGFLAAGWLHVWESSDGPIGCAVARGSGSGVVRIGFVYTPPEHRGTGVAESLVSTLSSQVLDGGGRCMLVTQLANPVSNAVYQRIGYRPVAELLRYRFEAG